MTWTSSSIENLQRVFTEGFAARDIAEPCSPSMLQRRQAKPSESWRAVTSMPLGFARRAASSAIPSETIFVGRRAGSTLAVRWLAIDLGLSPLADVVFGLAKSPRLFVRVLGTVGGIITMSDLQKPPVRMWLFGMITLIEIRISRLIEQMCPGDSWKQHVSEGRLQKAEALWRNGGGETKV